MIIAPDKPIFAFFYVIPTKLVLGLIEERESRRLINAILLAVLHWIKRRLGLNKDKTSIYVEFNAFGDELVPDIFTKIVGIEPTQIWLKGQPIKRGNRVSRILAKDNMWELDTIEAESLDIEIQLKQIYDVLNGKTSILKELKKKYCLEYRIDIVIKIENGEKPGMYFSRWILDFVNAIEAEIWIDLYCFS